MKFYTKSQLDEIDWHCVEFKGIDRVSKKLIEIRWFNGTDWNPREFHLILRNPVKNVIRMNSHF